MIISIDNNNGIFLKGLENKSLKLIFWHEKKVIIESHSQFFRVIISLRIRSKNDLETNQIPLSFSKNNME